MCCGGCGGQTPALHLSPPTPVTKEEAEAGQAWGSSYQDLRCSPAGPQLTPSLPHPLAAGRTAS